MRNATDAVGIVLKELKSQSRLGAFRLLVAVDGVNALWGRTTLKREDKSPVGKLRFSGRSHLWCRHMCGLRRADALAPGTRAVRCRAEAAAAETRAFGNEPHSGSCILSVFLAPAFSEAG